MAKEEFYTKKVLEHFKNPKNMGEIKNPDAKAIVGNPQCGDVMEITLKIKNGFINDAKFKTFGCVAAIATSSVATELIKGKTINEALKLKSSDILRELGGLPKTKNHCSNLASEAIKKAIKEYKRKNK